MRVSKVWFLKTYSFCFSPAEKRKLFSTDDDDDDDFETTAPRRGRPEVLSSADGAAPATSSGSSKPKSRRRKHHRKEKATSVSTRKKKEKRSHKAPSTAMVDDCPRPAELSVVSIQEMIAAPETTSTALTIIMEQPVTAAAPVPPSTVLDMSGVFVTEECVIAEIQP